VHFCTISTFCNLVVLHSSCLPQQRFIQRSILIIAKTIKCHQQLLIVSLPSSSNSISSPFIMIYTSTCTLFTSAFVRFTRHKYRLRIFYTYICIKVDNDDYYVKIKSVIFYSSRLILLR